MFKLFKKTKKAVETKPVEEPKHTNWTMFKAHVAPEAVIPAEPWTLAQERLNGHARDIGAERALRMYNAHKTKVQNQWINPLQSVNSGFGNAQDSFYMYQTVNYYQCYILAQDPLFTKVFNMLSRTPFSKGGQITVPDDRQDYDVDALEQAARKYRLWDEVREGVRSSYVTGGCLVYLDFGLTEQERGEPLDIRKINCHKFRGFRHIDPINITAVNVNTIDPAADDYMKPELWYVIGLGVCHRSHFIQFEANPPERPMRPLTLYFGMPLTQLIKQDVANSNLVSQGVANLINRSRYIYLKADASDFATDNAAQFRDRMEYMSYSQDNFGVCPLKNTEDVLQLTTSLTGFAENVEQAYLLISAKTDIPFTELMGKSASGMNATGEGDRRKWYDKCRTIQEDNKRNILAMYGIVAGKIADDGKFVTFPDYVFDPLEEATEKELADNIKAYTDVAAALAGLGANPDSLIEWLKQFKQFHLDSIEFDTSTPGLDGYDDDDPNGGGALPDITGGADLGDGFKAREDITPKVLAAIKAMNAKEDKNGMLHDEGNGQFTSGGDSGFNKPDADSVSGTGLYEAGDPVLKKQIEKAASVKINKSGETRLPELGPKETEIIKRGGYDPTGKVVIFKKETIERNDREHKDISDEEYNEILGTGLYLPEMVIPGHKSKPYFNMIARVGPKKNSVVLLDVDCSKECCEIVHCHWLRDRSRDRLEEIGEEIQKDKD